MELKNIKFAWSKYGRTNTGLEKREPEWSCQICGNIQPENFDPFLFTFAEHEYLRICALCQHERIINSITELTELIKRCRPKHHWIDELLHDY